MKKILLLGGSNCQKNALLHGKELGLQMIVADYSKVPAAVEYADTHVPVSTFDVQGCIEAARYFGVDGVMTMGTDQPVYTAAAVSEALNLPTFLSTGEAKSVTNKKVMKLIFDRYGIPSAKYHMVNRNSKFNEMTDFNGPLVLKPLDSQGQRGVYKLSGWDEVPHFIDRTLSFSRENEALAEEFYPSDEITISGWIQKSELFILTVTDRILLQDPVHIGICTSHKFPSKHMDQFEEIKKISEKIVMAFNLKNGPIYIQMLVGKDKGIIVNEVAARIGGAFEDVIIPKISGFNILDAVVKGSLNMPVDTDILHHYDCSKANMEASVQLMFADSGQIEYITPLETIKKLTDVIDVGYNFKIGDKISPIENATARFGHCVMVSENGLVDSSVDLFKSTFQILDEKGNNLFKVFHDG